MADMGKYLKVQELSASQNGEESGDGKHLDGTFVIQKNESITIVKCTFYIFWNIL
jgi:hypothetical protein